MKSTHLVPLCLLLSGSGYAQSGEPRAHRVWEPFEHDSKRFTFRDAHPAGVAGPERDRLLADVRDILGNAGSLDKISEGGRPGTVDLHVALRPGFQGTPEQVRNIGQEFVRLFGAAGHRRVELTLMDDKGQTVRWGQEVARHSPPSWPPLDLSGSGDAHGASSPAPHLWEPFDHDVKAFTFRDDHPASRAGAAQDRLREDTVAHLGNAGTLNRISEGRWRGSVDVTITLSAGFQGTTEQTRNMGEELMRLIGADGHRRVALALMDGKGGGIQW